MALAKGKTELLELLESSRLPPVDPMPWWLMKYKTLDYWYGDGGIENAAHFSLNFTTPHAEINAHRAEHVKTVAKALAFARETQSPPFPGSLNAELVQRGADLFHGRVAPAETKGFLACKTCHGTYTRKDSHTDPTQPGGWEVNYRFSHVLRNVKTDASYNEVLKTFRPIADHINKLEVYFAGQGTPELAPQATVPAKDGYVAPPLVGVWASAPYFHNGSVPTIEAVLNTAIRPEIWSAITATRRRTIWSTSACSSRSCREPSSTPARKPRPASRFSRRRPSIRGPTTTPRNSGMPTRAILSATI